MIGKFEVERKICSNYVVIRIIGVRITWVQLQMIIEFKLFRLLISEKLTAIFMLGIVNTWEFLHIPTRPYSITNDRSLRLENNYAIINTKHRPIILKL